MLEAMLTGATFLMSQACQPGKFGLGIGYKLNPQWRCKPHLSIIVADFCEHVALKGFEQRWRGEGKGSVGTEQQGHRLHQSQTCG